MGKKSKQSSTPVGQLGLFGQSNSFAGQENISAVPPVSSSGTIKDSIQTEPESHGGEIAQAVQQPLTVKQPVEAKSPAAIPAGTPRGIKTVSQPRSHLEFDPLLGCEISCEDFCRALTYYRYTRDKEILL